MTHTPKQLALAAVLAAAPLAAQDTAVWENRSKEYVSISLVDSAFSAGFLVVTDAPRERSISRALVLMAPKERAAITSNHLRYRLPEKRASNLQLAPGSKVYVTPMQSRGAMTPAFGPRETFFQRLEVDFHSGMVALRMEKSPQTRGALQCGFVLSGGKWNLPEEASRILVGEPGERRGAHAHSLDLTFLPSPEAPDAFPPVEGPERMQ